MKITPTQATLGAIVTDIDLAQIEALWDLYAVLIFKDQQLSSSQQLEFSRNFGRLEKGFLKSPDNLLAYISNTTRQGGLATDDSLQVRFNMGNELWHTDRSYKRIAANGLIGVPPMTP